MPDDKKKVGKPDRDRLSAGEAYEVRDLAAKFDLPVAQVKKVIEQQGPMREDVERSLRKMKR